ncbi:hypothetical protein [Cohnella caldifontis]|uniref:hypothetical protein n=1 Tax=Cohnella caldifontis TaxID=3027471 RepID=UPI0023ED7A29|nr:hypothetical protein [Cohnella sp. YIM B05605]
MVRRGNDGACRPEVMLDVAPLFDHWLNVVREHRLGQGETAWVAALPPRDGLCRMELLAWWSRARPDLIREAADKLEAEACAIDAELRASLFDELEANDFAAVRQIAMLLDINRLIAVYWSCGCVPESETFLECAEKLLASTLPDERMRTSALKTLGTIETPFEEEYPF